MALILGVGPGTFAVLFACGFAIVVFLLGALLKPDRIVFIAVGCAAIPLIVFGLIYASPRPGDYDDKVIDYYYPVRVTLIILLLIGMLLSVIAQRVLPIFFAPGYTAPKGFCRRKALEANHPSWIQ
jgi:hypothetical protein